MFVVLAYDINQKRVGKALKICRKYLVHVQKSVFEGVLTDKRLTMLKADLKKIIDVSTDNVCIYQWESAKFTKKEQIGAVKNFDNIF